MYSTSLIDIADQQQNLKAESTRKDWLKCARKHWEPCHTSSLTLNRLSQDCCKDGKSTPNDTWENSSSVWALRQGLASFAYTLGLCSPITLGETGLLLHSGQLLFPVAWWRPGVKLVIFPAFCWPLESHVNGNPWG